MTSSSTKTVRRLFGVITLDQMYTTIALPIITLIFFDPSSRLFPTDTTHAVRGMWYGICISTPYFINLFFAPFLSALSDEFGRKKILIFEILSAFVYTLLAGLGVAFGLLWLVITSFVIRGAFSRTNTTALSIVGDVCNKDNKMACMSRLQFAIAVGACAGPIIGGLIGSRFFFSSLNYSLPFFIAACFALLNSILTYRFIDETLQQTTSEAWSRDKPGRVKSNLQAAKYVITHPDVLKLSLILLLFQISWSGYYQFISPVLKTVYHFNSHMLGLFIGMVAFWLIIASGPIFKLLHRYFNTQTILNIGACLVLAGFSITIATYYHLLSGTWPLWIAAMPIATGDVIAYICLTTLYSNVMPDHMQGKVMGVNFVIVGLTWGVSGLLGGILISYTPILPLLLAPLGVIVSLFTINAKLGRSLALNHSI